MIPTVEDYLKEKVYITQDGVEDIHDSLSTVRDVVIELIQLHVTEALEQANNSAELRISENSTNEEPTFVDTYDDGCITITISKKSILEAYPLENIK